MPVALPERTRQDPVRLLDRADAHALAGDLGTAAALYRKVLADRDDPAVWRSLGRTELGRGRLEAAERCFRRAGSHLWLARTLERGGRIELAWHEALKARPSPVTARLQARLAARLGFFRRGVEILEPHHDAASSLQRARLLDHLGDHRRAWLTAVQANLAGDPPPPPDAPTTMADPDPERDPVLVTGLPGSGAEVLADVLNAHPRLAAAVVDPRRAPLAAARRPEAAVIRADRDPDEAALTAFFQPLRDWPGAWTRLRAELGNAAAVLDSLAATRVRWEDLSRDPEAALRLVLARLGRSWHEDCLAVARDRIAAARADQPLGGAAAYARFFRAQEEQARRGGLATA